jgi:hypothetical protein
VLTVTNSNQDKVPVMGPPEKTPSLDADPGFISDNFIEDDNAGSKPEDEDSYWNLDTRQAKGDMHDLRVFRRVHISPSINPQRNIKRSYVFFDIAIGTDTVGRVIFELVRDLYCLV